MGNKVTSAFIGALAVVAMSSRSTFAAANRARRKGEDAQDTADDALSLAQMLSNSGDVLRIQTAQASDFLGGLCYPNQSATSEPSAFATAPAIIQRPDLNESQAIAPAGFPVAVNDYTEDGRLRDPAAAMTGELFGTGLALTHPNVRAFLMGLARDGAQPSAFQLAQVYRFAGALDQELRVLAPTAGSGKSFDDFATLWRRFFSAAGPAFRGLVSAIVADMGEVKNTTAETPYGDILIPGDLLSVGEVARVTVHFHASSGNSTDTLAGAIRLNGISGTVLVRHKAADMVDTGDGFGIQLELTRRADAGGYSLYAVSARPAGATTSATSASAPVKTFSVAPGASFNLTPTGTWSVASTSNISTVSAAIVEKL